MVGSLNKAILGLTIMIIAGMAMTSSVSVEANTPFQILVLAILLVSLTPLMLPLTQALGGEVVMPLSNNPMGYGVYPLVAWVLGGVIIGFMSSDRGEAVRASLTTTSLYYLIWITLTMVVLPNIHDPVYWSNYLNIMFSYIITRSPLDLALIYIIPLTTSILIDTLLGIEKSRQKGEVKKIRVWEF